MKPINEMFVNKLPAASPELKPLPFPGRYPTRIWASIGEQTYLGKPTVELAGRIINALSALDNVEFIEFDRHAKFFAHNNNSGPLGTKEYFGWYHPNVPMDMQSLVAWFGKPFHTLRVGKHSFYSTFPALYNQPLMQAISQRLNPQAKPIETATKRPKPTRSRPQRNQFLTYEAYALDLAKWRAENPEYVAWIKAEKAKFAYKVS